MIAAAVDAVIFDIDGTLWDASSPSAQGWNLGLAKLGIPDEVSAEQISMVTGNPVEECVDTLLPGMRSKHPHLLDTLSDCEEAVVRRVGGRFYEGALEAVSELASYMRVFLVSNCQEWYLRLFLDLSELGPAVSGFDCHGSSGLPKSEMISRITRTHSMVEPVYVGDTAGDEAAAQSAGVAYVHVSWGFGKPAGAPRIVHSFPELFAHLRGAEVAQLPNKPLQPTGRAGG